MRPFTIDEAGRGLFQKNHKGKRTQGDALCGNFLRNAVRLGASYPLTEAMIFKSLCAEVEHAPIYMSNACMRPKMYSTAAHIDLFAARESREP
jgi:hypothetical protein